MDNKPIFQFKKAKVTISGIDPDGPSEYELLIKHNSNDLPEFIHYHKMWISPETPDEIDAEGKVTKPGNKHHPLIQIAKGFIKDEKFLVTSQQTIAAQSYHECHKKFKASLEYAITSFGYKKDEERYSGIFGQPQQYYANERTPLLSNAGNTLSQQGITQPATGGNSPVKIISKKKSLANLLSNISNLQTP
jgi:hypothetical protein